MLAGVGNDSIKARNQSLRELPAKRAASGIQWQVVSQQAMPELGLRLRDHLVRLRQLLDVVDAGEEGISVGLRGADLEHMQDDLRVLRIVLVPSVVQRLPRPRQRD